MITVKIKPLSVNEAWQGKRFKTVAYSRYRRALAFMLPKLEVPAGPLELHLEFGFSNSASDFDNPVKCFVDSLQEKYGFNDKLIMRAIIEKKKVKKGEEYIKFQILPYK
jgi:Holliday junction resolvase RusA-like endonuclease